MEIALDRGVEGFEAPAAADDDPAYRHQRVVAVHFVGQLEEIGRAHV